MTTRSGRYHGRYGATEVLSQKMGLPLTEVQCARCKNHILSGGGVFYRNKVGKWLTFCRFDCAQLQVGKKAKLYDRDQYAAKVLDDAIRKK